MINIHVESVREPFDKPETAATAMQVISRAEGMGLLQGLGEIETLDKKSFGKVINRISRAGIGTKGLAGKLQLESDRLDQELKRLLRMLDESPMPDSEWKAVISLLGDDLLQRLLHLSKSSLARYAGGRRKTPQHVADQLHFLALVIGDLRGGYNEYGIRRWFQRPRTFLNKKSVIQVLKKGWTPYSETAQAIRQDAAWVTSGVE